MGACIFWKAVELYIKYTVAALTMTDMPGNVCFPAGFSNAQQMDVKAVMRLSDGFLEDWPVLMIEFKWCL